MVATPNHHSESAQSHPEHPFRSLTPADAALLQNLFALSRNPFALAQHHSLPLSECLAWLARPHIAAARDLIAGELAEGLKTEALEILRHIARTSPDPIEQRRAASQVLRVLTARTPRSPASPSAKAERTRETAAEHDSSSPGEQPAPRAEAALSTAVSRSPSAPSLDLPPPSPAEEFLARSERLYAELAKAGFTEPGSFDAALDAEEDALADEDDDLQALEDDSAADESPCDETPDDETQRSAGPSPSDSPAHPRAP